MRNGTDAGASQPPELAEERARFRDRIRRERGAGIAGADLDDRFLDAIDQFAALLFDRSATLALIGKADRPRIYSRHLLDSLNPISLFEKPPERLLDIGSGGGLPGIPLALAWRGTSAVLLESRERKAAFLERTVRTLALRTVRVVCERLEEHARKVGPDYDVLLIRAVAEPARLVETVSACCVPGARWIYFLGGGAEVAEIVQQFARTDRRAESVIGMFGGRLLTGLV